jgi:hypothetical protein
VNPAGGTGGVTVTPVINSSGPWFNEQAISLSNTGNLTALSITIVVQRTTGISHSGQYNTVGSQILQSNSSTTSTITYTFTLATGQTLGVGSNRLFAAQTSGTGTVHRQLHDRRNHVHPDGTLLSLKRLRFSRVLNEELILSMFIELDHGKTLPYL